MSIKIVIQASGLTVSANLKDEALTTILQLIQEKRDDSAPTIPISTVQAPVGQIVGTDSLLPGNDGEEAIKAVLNERGGAELLNQLRWDSFPEKILLLAVWHEARGGTTPWRSADM